MLHISPCVQVVPYDQLMQSLEITAVRELEDFIITHCFYASLVLARLDQKQRCLMVCVQQTWHAQKPGAYRGHIETLVFIMKPSLHICKGL